MTLIAELFHEIIDSEKRSSKSLYKKSPFRGPFDKQHVKVTKRFWYLNHTTLVLIIDHCERNWVGKNLS